MSAPLLEVHGLSVRHGGLLALDGVSLTIDEGMLVGLIGPNGAGKTTFIDALSGFTPASGGRVLFAGEPIDDLGPHQRARRGFVRTFQSLELFDDLTVAENLVVAAGTPTWRSTLTDAFRTKRRDGTAGADALARVGLADAAEARPSELSNGDRHLVALARALVAGPRLVLLDEPTAGLDPKETEAMSRVLRELPGQGTSVLLVDHDMALVLGICDRVDVLDQGRLVASGPPADIAVDPTVVAAYLGAPPT